MKLCKKYSFDVRDVPYELYREGVAACRYGSKGNVVDAVYRIEDYLRKRANSE